MKPARKFSFYLAMNTLAYAGASAFLWHIHPLAAVPAILVGALSAWVLVESMGVSK